MVGSTRTPHQRWCRRPNAPSPRSFASRFAAARSCGVSSRRVRGSQQTFCHAWLELARCTCLYPIQTDSACGSYHRFKASCIRPPPVVETSWSLTSNQLYTETTPDPPPFRRRSGHASTRARGCCTAPCRLSWMLHAPIDSNHCVPPLTFRPDAEPPTHPHGMKDVPQQGYCVSVFPPSYGCVFLMHTSRHPSKRRHI